jgi:hypothetical protein
MLRARAPAACDVTTIVDVLALTVFIDVFDALAADDLDRDPQYPNVAEAVRAPVRT